MDRISTSATYQSALLGIMTAQNQESVAQAQVTTGKVGSDLKSYASSMDALTAMQTMSSRLTTYQANAGVVADKLTMQDQALTTVQGAASNAHTAVLSAIGTGDASTLTTALNGYLTQAVSALNTQYQGQYLFGGGQPGQPVDATSMTALADPASSVPGLFHDGTEIAKARLDDSTTVSTGFTASGVGQNLISALQSIAQNGPYTGKLTAAQTTFLQGVLPTLQTANDALTGQVAQNGVVSQQVSAVQDTLSDRTSALGAALNNITNVDPATAVTNLQLAQTALQASAQVFSTLQGSSLLNVLSAS